MIISGSILYLQSKRENTMINKCTFLGLIAAALLSGKSYAKTNGVYITGQLGYTQAHYGTQNVDDTYQIKSTDMQINTVTLYDGNSGSARGEAIRVALGFEINKFWALEFGGARYANSRMDQVSTTTLTNTTLQTASTTIKTNIADFLVKGTLPLGDQIYVFAKTGLAFVSATYETETVTLDNPEISDTTDSASKNTNFLRPEVALGAGFSINENFAVDISYSRIFSSGNIDDEANYLPDLDFMAVGLTFKFE